MMAGAKVRSASRAVVFLVLSILLAVPTGAAAAFAETMTTAAPTTAVPGGYDLSAKLVATVHTSEVTGRLAAPMRSLDPRVNRLVTSFAVAAKADKGQRIFRAVEPDELAGLAGSGQYRNIPGIGDGKYFFSTKQQADAFAEMMVKRNMGGPYCTTWGCIPSNLLQQVERISPAGEGAAHYVPETMLPSIDDIIIHGR